MKYIPKNQLFYIRTKIYNTVGQLGKLENALETICASELKVL